MSIATLKGEGTELGGAIKESAGSLTGDRSLQASGVTDQLTGKVQQGYGAARDAVAQNVAPYADKARSFARDRPFATAALVGVVGLAFLNTLRGK
ncbi:MAG TPA: CsbD family protein [Sphingomonas sp.]|jgi:uncharacterized protein YjbJ (UPF0337 family)|uniref:CsbD family protein n=1 Tax=Sphingomonas sp. TaxID=28214 RepID=UPI002ED7E49A